MSLSDIKAVREVGGFLKRIFLGVGVGITILLIGAIVYALHARAHRTSANADHSPAAVNAEQVSGQSVAGLPPVVVETQPPSGARDVAPGITEIRVRFSKPMTDESWSWSTAWENSTPESVGPPHYLADQRTCIMKVRLQPDRTYGWWLNSGKFHSFQDQGGRPAVPYLLIFHTKRQ